MYKWLQGSFTEMQREEVLGYTGGKVKVKARCGSMQKRSKEKEK